jgi:hypothetical protein
VKPIAELYGIPTITRGMLALITPVIADKMLQHNTVNRKVRPSHVKYLERQILSGNWIETHQGIAFSKGGALFDGQHRLIAIVNAKKAVRMYVFDGLSNDAFSAIDIGHIARTQSDVTGIDRRVIEIVNAYNHYFTGATGADGLRLSANELTQMYSDRQVHFDAACELRPKDRHLCRAYIWAGIAYYSEHNHEKAVEFAYGLTDPTTNVKQAQLFKDYLYRQGSESSVPVNLGRLLYCMNAHYNKVSPSRIGTKKREECFV